MCNSSTLESTIFNEIKDDLNNGCIYHELENLIKISNLPQIKVQIQYNPNSNSRKMFVEIAV